MKPRPGLAVGQRWAIRDVRYEGWRYLTVESIEDGAVRVRGARGRRSTWKSGRFGRGTRFIYCGFDGPGLLPPFSDRPVAFGCLSCPPVTDVLDLRTRLDTGFGYVEVTCDNDVVWMACRSELILAHFERRARLSPPGDWRVRICGAMRERLYQRQGPSRWVLVAIGMGFA
jgi:hypothetical protein